MRLPGRVQAAITLLTPLLAGQGAADRSLQTYFQNRRFIGSSDRRFISQVVYDVMRQRGQLTHALNQDPHQLPDARLMVAKSIQQKGHDLLQAFDGSEYGPRSLDERERDLLARHPAEPCPLWAEYNLPPWLMAEIVGHYGDQTAPLLQGLDTRAPLDLRVNLLKTTLAETQKALSKSGIKSKPMAFAKTGLRIDEPVSLTREQVFVEHWVEPQDEAAQICAALVDPISGEQIIDFCAGAGGKSLALAEMTQNGCPIIAGDIDGQRLKRLEYRMGQTGAKHITIRPWGEVDSFSDLIGSSTRVLVDAPCSGSGVWRRNPQDRWRWSETEWRSLLKTQQDILQRAAQLVKPGGRLIYATCSILHRENQEQVGQFLEKNPEFEALPFADIWQKVLNQPPPDPQPYLQLLPHRHHTDGFFVALLQRKAG